MNFPRHVWNENSKGPLLEFLKAAKQCNSTEYCNREEYERLQPFFPLSDDIKNDLKAYTDKAADVCIDITESDDDGKNAAIQNHESHKDCDTVIGPTALSLGQDHCDYLTEMIKDNLHIEKLVSKSLLEDLSKVDNASLKKIFSDLVATISLEEVQILWESITDDPSVSNEILESYISYLLLPKVKQEFAFELNKVFLNVCEKHTTLLKSALLKEFVRTDQSNEEVNTLMQYVSSLPNEYKTDITSTFIHTINQLHSTCIPIIQSLLNPKVGDDVLNKLIEIMASAVVDFTNDNAYGKLLFKAINLLERHSPALEQPMKRILGGHQSIWKIKIETLIGCWFNDTLTQSFV